MNETAPSAPMAFLTGQALSDKGTGPPFVLQKSAYFRGLAARGYVLDVYQTDYLDLCRTGDATVERCLTYPGNSARYIVDMTLPIRAKAIALGLYFLHHASHSFARARGVYLSALASRAPASALQWLAWDGRVFLSSSRLLKYVEADAESGVRGRVFLIHAMDPHAPYNRAANCRTVPQLAEWLRADDPFLAANANTEAGRMHRYRRYWMQFTCLAKELDEFLTWVSALPGARDAVVVIHGDHGSRIGVRRQQMRVSQEFTASDVADYYSTLFAVKAPALSAGVVDDVAILGELLTAARRSDFAAIARRDVDTVSVFLEDRPTRLGALLLKRQAVVGGRSRLVPAPR